MSRAHERPAPMSEDALLPSLHVHAYNQGLRALDDQRDELNGIRTRVVQFVAFIGSASGFLIGSSLTSGRADDFAFYVVAGLASIASVLMLILTALLLAPSNKFEYRLDPQVLVHKWINRDVPRRPTEAEFLTGLAALQSEMIQDNEGALRKLRNLYRGTILSGLLSILLWIASVWIFV